MCKTCNQDMRKADGCLNIPVVISGIKYDRIKFSDEDCFFGNFEEGSRCGDCNARRGHYHHPGCDLEQCPVCTLQLISCDCDVE